MPWLLVKAWILPLPNTVQEQLDEAIDHGFDGMIVYIDRIGQSPQYVASGWHNRKAKIPAKPHALFKIASISKLYNAVAVTKLVSSGRLHLDKTIAEYLPELVMRGYHVGHPFDLKKDEHGMLATAEDVGTFVRALNDGSMFRAGEQEIYSSIYEYEHSGWVPGYQSFAEYNKELDTVVIGFYSTTDSELYNWNLSQIINNRIVKILKKQNSS